MEEIDHIILHSLRQIGCDIPENEDDRAGLTVLEPRDVVKCVSRCLKRIEPTLELAETMPSGMAQKYGVTLALAESCVQVGYRGEIGYQTFLHSNNVAELRRVFMFLIDRLPREDDQPQVSREHTDEEKIDLAIRNSLANCLKPRQAGLPLVEEKRHLDFSAPDFDARRSIFAQTTPHNIWSTLISHHSTASSADLVKPIPPPRREHLGQSAAAPSPAGVKEEEEAEKLETTEVEEQKSSAAVDKEDPLHQRRNQVQILREKLSLKRTEQEQLAERIRCVKREFKAGEGRLKEIRAQKKIKERTLLVLENPEENIQKLQKMIDGSAEKINRLQEQWLQHKLPLQKQIDELNAQKELESSKTKVTTDQIQEALEKEAEIRSEASVKAQLYSQWLAELGKVNQKIDRTAYTCRILEIIGNIRKQKTDIDKILRDTRGVQKDINSITGKLERQFTITDDLLFGHAKRDEQTKRAYKLFLKAHTDCGELAKCIQETGKISRELKDIEEQIENSRARNTAANAQQVSLDLEEMTAENEALFQQIQEMRFMRST